MKQLDTSIRWRPALLATAMLAAACLPGYADEDVTQTDQTDSDSLTEPQPSDFVVFTGNQPQRSRLRLEELTLELGFEAEWRRRRVSTERRDSRSPAFTQRNTARRLEETLGLRTSGSDASANLFRYFLDVRGGFSQEHYTEQRPGSDLRNSPDGSLLEYDTRLNLLPAGKLSANLTAFKQQDRVPRMFLPSLDRERERYLAELFYNDRTLPMRLAFESTYEELLSRSGRLEDDERRSDKYVKYEAAWLPSEDHQLRLDYEYNDRREVYSGLPTRFTTTRNYLTLSHALRFGPDRRSRLDTIARFQDESGDLARDLAEVAPNLRWQHTDALASLWRGQFLRESYDGRTIRHHRAEGGLNFQPSPELDAALNIYALTQDYDKQGSLDEWGGLATLALFRPNELGRLAINATYNYADVRSEQHGPDALVIGEAVTFRDPLPAILARTDVNLATLVVTDAARRRTYFPGRDYTTLSVGRYTALLRVRSGRIVDGETVLASYRQRGARGYSLTRNRLDLRIQQEFRDGLTPYYALTLQDEDLDRPQGRGYLPRDVQRHRLGLNWRQRRASTGGELEYNDDAIDPYKAVHLRADAELFQKAEHVLTGRAAASFFSFDGAKSLPARDATLVDLGLTWRKPLTPQLEATAVAAYRFENDTRYGRTHGVDLSAALHWRIGLFTASFEIEYDRLNQPGSRDGDFAAWVKLRREFPLLRSPQP